MLFLEGEKISSYPDSDDSMPALQSVSATSNENDSIDDDSDEECWREELRASRPVAYSVSKLIPLFTSPAWDEINVSLNIRMKGSDSLMSFCDEICFARSHLKKTMSALLKGSKQARAALFCFEQIQSNDITEDLQIAFAKLLPHSLLHAERSPRLRTAIQQLRTQHLIYQRLPVETRKAISDYLPSTSGSRTADQTASTFPSDTITKPSAQFASQKFSTTLNSSTAHPKKKKKKKKGQKSSSTAQSPSSAGQLTPSQAQSVPPTSQTQPSPNDSQKASTASGEPPKAQTTSRSSSLSTATQKYLAVSRTLKEPSNDSQPATPDPEPSTALGPSTASQSTLGSPHPSKSSASSQGLLDSSQHPQDPSPQKRRKSRRK